MDDTRSDVFPANRWDENTKVLFKWKFYRLVLMLNLIILIVAIAIIALFRAPEG